MKHISKGNIYKNNLKELNVFHSKNMLLISLILNKFVFKEKKVFKCKIDVYHIGKFV